MCRKCWRGSAGEAPAPYCPFLSSEAGAMSCVHFDAQCSGKCNMDRSGRTSAIVNPKERFGSRAKARMRASARLFRRCLLQKHE